MQSVISTEGPREAGGTWGEGAPTTSTVLGTRQQERGPHRGAGQQGVHREVVRQT